MENGLNSPARIPIGRILISGIVVMNSDRILLLYRDAIAFIDTTNKVTKFLMGHIHGATTSDILAENIVIIIIVKSNLRAIIITARIAILITDNNGTSGSIGVVEQIVDTIEAIAHDGIITEGLITTGLDENKGARHFD